MKSFTRPVRPKSGSVVKASDMENHARAIEEIQNALLGDTIISKRRKGDSKPPFFPILSGNDTDGYKLRMIKGYICARHLKYGVDAVVNIEVTDIPGDPDPDLDRLVVESGDKIYCTVAENEHGEAETGVIAKATSWPESDAPSLIGGDDQTGANGTRYIRLCEIVTVSGIVKVKVLHTGHIDHFAPVLAENTTTSPSTNEARVMKEWNAASGRWEFRYIEGSEADYGVFVEEFGDTVGLDTKGGNLDLTIETAALQLVSDGGSGYTYYKDVAGNETLYFRKGLYVGKTEPTEDLVGSLDTASVSYITDPL